MRLQGKIAVVTGAGSGIGKAIALTLAKEGADVAIVDLNEAGAKATAEEVQSAGRQSLAAVVDITQSRQVKEMVRQVQERFGRIDILVNCAGWDKVEPFIESTEETWDKVLAINLKGHIMVTRAVLDDMMSHRRGRIVNISSDAGRNGSTGECVYSAAKAGLLGFTKTLAREMARYGIAVNCVCPGPTETPMFAEITKINPNLAEALIKAIPLRRLGKPQDIAWAVAFLASDEAEYITGQTLSVSGGLTMF